MTMLKPELQNLLKPVDQTDTPCIYQNLEFRWKDDVFQSNLKNSIFSRF